MHIYHKSLGIQFLFALQSPCCIQKEKQILPAINPFSERVEHAVVVDLNVGKLGGKDWVQMGEKLESHALFFRLPLVYLPAKQFNLTMSVFFSFDLFLFYFIFGLKRLYKEYQMGGSSTCLLLGKERCLAFKVTTVQ